VPQFRIEFIQDPAGLFIAELYHPEEEELLARTEAVYPTQAAALLAVVQLFKEALSASPPPSAGRRSRPKAPRRRAAPKRKPAARKARKRPKRRSARR